jgi:hypothetical protein
VPSNSSSNISEAEEAYEKGVELLTLGKPSKAIPLLEKSLKLNSKEEVKSALLEAKNGLMWSSPKFCVKCKKLVEPTSQYPNLEYDGFCPRCGQELNFDKELAISYLEFFTKLIFFGIYIVAVLVFCAMPNPQLTLTGIWVIWNRLVSGVVLAISFTPIVTMFLILINDPWGVSLRYLIFGFFDPLGSNPPLYFVASVLVLGVTIYLYFFLLFTPFLAVHKKRMWISWKHQKKLLIYTAIFCGIVIVPRIASRVFY